MKPLSRLIQLMCVARQGRRIAVIGKSLPSTLVEVGDGVIFFRNYAKCMLMSIRVDTVWFVEYPPPEEIERLGRNLTCISLDPRIIKGDADDN